MSLKRNVKIYRYGMAKSGINLWSDLVDVRSDECLYCKNLIWRNGMVKRYGMTKYVGVEVTAGKAITGLHRFYYGSSQKQLLVSSGAYIKRYDKTNNKWVNILTDRTDGKNVYFTTWGGVGKCYITNGTDMPVSWDGSVTANVTSAPSKTIQFLPYQDRLLSIDNNNPGFLRWSGSYTDSTWETADACSVKPDTQLFGMIHHSVTNVSEGYETKVLLAGANGMYLFSGTDLRTPYTTGKYTIQSLSTNIGCNAPKTMVWTPKGSMWLGIDGQVYLLPFTSSTPIPVATKIRSNRTDITALESLPSAYIQNASAVYYDGFYILSVTPKGDTKNSLQYWLAVNRIKQDDRGLWSPWFGPMQGQTISHFTVLSGAGDKGELLAGENDASKGSYIYQAFNRGVYTDNGSNIAVDYQTYYHNMGSIFVDKRISRLEVEGIDSISGSVFSFNDTTGGISGGGSISLADTGVYWGDKKWGQGYWSTIGTKRVRQDLSEKTEARRLSIRITQTSGNAWELFLMMIKAKHLRHVFGKEAI